MSDVVIVSQPPRVVIVSEAEVAVVVEPQAGPSVIVNQPHDRVDVGIGRGLPGADGPPGAPGPAGAEDRKSVV